MRTDEEITIKILLKQNSDLKRQLSHLIGIFEIMQDTAKKAVEQQAVLSAKWVLERCHRALKR